MQKKKKGFEVAKRGVGAVKRRRRRETDNHASFVFLLQRSRDDGAGACDFALHRGRDGALGRLVAVARGLMCFAAAFDENVSL